LSDNSRDISKDELWIMIFDLGAASWALISVLGIEIAYTSNIKLGIAIVYLGIVLMWGCILTRVIITIKLIMGKRNVS